MKAQFLTEVDIQITRLGSEIIFQSQMIEALAKENADLKEQLKQSQELLNARDTDSKLDAKGFGEIRSGLVEGAGRSTPIVEEAFNGSTQEDFFQNITEPSRSS